MVGPSTCAYLLVVDDTPLEDPSSFQLTHSLYGAESLRSQQSLSHSRITTFYAGLFFWKKRCRNSQEGKDKYMESFVTISLYNITVYLHIL
jgi:hypothetical protein